MSRKKVRTAVIPVAGLGTRFLPATKSIPKEMLPILDRPCIDYIVAEAAEAGIERIIFVTARGKDAMIDYFDHAPALEDHLEKTGKLELLEKVREAGRRVDVITIRQREALGLGHAVLTAKPIVRDEPFAVLLADDIVFSEKPVIGEMIKIFNQTQEAVIALLEISESETEKYGICAGPWEKEAIMRIELMMEKPHPKLAPSRFGIVGRYVLPSSIFDLLSMTPPGKGGEIQLTDALHMLARRKQALGFKFEGDRFDTGNALGLLHATMYQAARRSDTRAEFEKILDGFSSTT
jgi:UTP--glucose-1-phosphate uridylyltransferase